MKTKRIVSLLVAVVMCLTMFTTVAVTSSVAETLPEDAYIVNAAWTSAASTPATYTFGGKTYALTYGTNAFDDFQTALDAAPAGATVILAPGTYSGTIIIQKSVTVLGAKYGVDPNTKGATYLDDWTLSANRGSNESQITATIYCGNTSSAVYAAASAITFDGVMLTGGGHFRSNNGSVGSCELTFKNIYIKNSTGTEPFYFAPYYPTGGPNSYRRYITMQNIRIEGQKTKAVMQLCYETADISGIYMANDCTMQFFSAAGTTDGAVYSSDVARLYIHDCLFRNPVQRIMYIDYNPNTSIASKKLNANIAQRTKVENIIENCVFLNAAASATDGVKYELAFREDTDNVYFTFRNNTFYQSTAPVSGFYALAGYSGTKSDYGSRTTVVNNRFIGYDGDFIFTTYNDTLDLNGNYAETREGDVVSPRTNTATKILDWWWMDRAMTLRSDSLQPVVPADRLYTTDEIKFFGRTYVENDVTYCNWTNAGFEFKFNGTSAYATVLSNAPGGTGTAYLSVYVDGIFDHYVKLASTQNYLVLAENLTAGEHTIRVVKRTNTRSSTAGLQALWLGEGGTKLAPNPQSERKMEFVGDSITVGYGTLGKSGDSWSTETEDGTITWAAITAKYFGAENNTIAVSGRGIVKNTGGDTNNMAPEMYEYTDWNNRVQWDHTQYVPDVIVINYGTNDNSSNGPVISDAEFGAGMKAFVQQVRADNPTSTIIYAYGFMGERFKDVVISTVAELNAEGDSNVYYYRLAPVTTAEKAIGGHPSAAAGADRAVGLIDFVSEITGWDAGCTHNNDVTVVTQPTCTKEGVQQTKCKLCGYTTTEPIATKPHTWDGGKRTKEPTCVAKGVMTYTCTVCKTATYTEDIDPTGIHTWDSGKVTTQPTCADKGIKTYTCTVCNTATYTEDIDPTGAHTWDAGVVTLLPTETTTGTKIYTCAVCDGTKTETLPKLDPVSAEANLFKLTLSEGVVEDDLIVPGKYRISWDLDVIYNPELSIGDYDFNVLEYGIKYAATYEDLYDYMRGLEPAGNVLSKEYAKSATGLSFVYKTTRYHMNKVVENRKRFAIGYIRYELNGEIYEAYSVADGTTTIYGGLIGGIGETVEIDDGLQD